MGQDWKLLKFWCWEMKSQEKLHFLRVRVTSKFGEFISPAEVVLVCLKFILSFIKFCSLVTKLWLILNQGQ